MVFIYEDFLKKNYFSTDTLHFKQIIIFQKFVYITEFNRK